MSFHLHEMEMRQAIWRRTAGPGCEGTIPESAPLSDGEVHFLWWFIQGSIMNPGTRWRLRRAWGLCARHAWGALAVEAAFREDYLHGPAILYEDLIERARSAFMLRGALQARRLGRRLRATGPCMMCEMGLDAASAGIAREELLVQGRDSTQLRAFAEATKPYWSKAVCGRCVKEGSYSLCRIHLLEAATHGFVANLDDHRSRVQDILGHLRIYRQSFVWGYHGTETDEDRAALISAVGWCSGWQPWIDTLRS